MLLRDTMWEIFLSTGNIDAYLAYRACLDCHPGQHGSTDESTELNGLEFYWNNLLREVRWH